MAVALLGLVSRVRADDEPRRGIVVECQIVSLPAKLAVPLIPALHDSEKFDRAWADVQKFIQENQASLVANPTARGEAARSESLEEIYIRPSHVRLAGFDTTTIQRAKSGEEIVFEQPKFEAKVVTTSLSLRNGGRVLLGAHPVKEPPNHTEFFILKAEVCPP